MKKRFVIVKPGPGGAVFLGAVQDKDVPDLQFDPHAIPADSMLDERDGVDTPDGFVSPGMQPGTLQLIPWFDPVQFEADTLATDQEIQAMSDKAKARLFPDGFRTEAEKKAERAAKRAAAVTPEKLAEQDAANAAAREAARAAMRAQVEATKIGKPGKP